jgi:anti-sigma factor RsiW
MSCPERQAELNALIDGELQPTPAQALAAHVAACPACAATLAGLLALRVELAALAPPGPAPAAVRARIEAGLTRAAAAPERAAPGWAGRRGAAARGAGIGFGAGLALAAMLALALFAARPGGAGHAAEERATLAALAGSVHRAELPAALLAPAGTARTGAAGWLAAQDLPAVPAPALGAAGFRFAGYRGDLVAGHRATVLAYRRDGRQVSLFAWPAGHGEPAHPPRDAAAAGITIVYWNNGRTEFWAAGPDAGTVARFVAAYRRAL